MSQARTRVFQCPLCPHVGTRLTRMKSHAEARHGIKDGTHAMTSYTIKCVKLSKSGWRETSRERVNSCLGKYSRSTSHQNVARKILNGHLIRITPEYDKSNRDLQKTLPTPQRGRALTGHCLKASKLKPSFADGELCSLSQAYVKGMASLSNVGRNHILANAKMIHRVVKFGMQELVTFSEGETIMSMKCARAFVDEANVVLRPNSVRNHCAAVLSALSIATLDPSVQRVFEGYSRQELDRATEDWKKLKTYSDKSSRCEQKLKVMQGNLPNLPLFEICAFFQDLVHVLVPESLRKIRTKLADGSRDVPSELRVEWRNVTAFVATLFLLHGQRLCVALELTVDEVHSASFSLGYAVIRIRQHKTAKAGPAAVAIRMQHYQILEDFAKIRDTMCTGRRQLIISHTGNAATHILSLVEDALVAREVTPTVSHKAMRRVLETNGYLLGQAKTQAAAAQSDVNRYLCHGAAVTNLHYKYRTDAFVVTAAQSVETILTQILVIKHFDKTLKVKPYEEIPGNF